MSEEISFSVFERIFRDSLGANEREKVLIFTDDVDSESQKFYERLEICHLFFECAKKLDLNPEKLIIKSSGKHGSEPEKKLWEKAFGSTFCDKLFKKFTYDNISKKKIPFHELLNFFSLADLTEVPQIVIALSYYSTSHTMFRKLLNHAGTRYASMPMIEKKMFLGPLDIDFLSLEKETIEMAKLIGGKERVSISSKTGTDITVNIKDVIFYCDTGNLKTAGSFGNLPAGEVYGAPNYDDTNGRLAIEFFSGRKLTKPAFMYFKDGVVMDYEGEDDFKSFLDKIFKEDERNRKIAEIGFGTNRKAKDPANVLEAEKIYGTCHIAIGDNSTFGGENYATVHIDFVIFDPILRWT